jgi:hypothetical protein
MTTLTHTRMRTLHQPGPASENMLKDLHDTIYQWTETIPAGGNKVDISEALRIIHQKHLEQLEAEKKQAAHAAEVESIDSYLDADDYGYDSQDAEYDDEDDDYSY